MGGDGGEGDGAGAGGGEGGAGGLGEGGVHLTFAAQSHDCWASLKSSPAPQAM